MSDAAKQAQMSDLMTALSSANNEITILKSRIAVVVTQDNRAIPPQGTTIDMAQIREQLSNRIEQVERDASIARGNMTLDRERNMAGIERGRLEMAADAAAARAAIRADLTRAIVELERRLALLEARNGPVPQPR
jgi:predicted RNase H-like nuclease (RuvC/YqgF family)